MRTQLRKALARMDASSIALPPDDSPRLRLAMAFYSTVHQRTNELGGMRSKNLCHQIRMIVLF